MAKHINQLLYLLPDRLMIHPENLRRFYPDEQVREMADSIRAAKGVIQPLRIVQNGNSGKYFVVDGNMRLSGARLLEKSCPRLKCELVNESKARQLIAMVITAKFRYDPDPISKALHYERLIKKEHYTILQIAHATGIHARTVENRLKLLKLEPEIQELVGNLKLPADWKVTQALLSIPDTRVRVKLAQRLSRDNVSIKTIIASCDRLVSRMKESSMDPGRVPALSIGQQRTFGKTVPADATAKLQQVRDSAKAMCEKCELKLSSLGPESAWSLIAHAAEGTCARCNIREVKGTCNQCPGVEIIRHLISAMGEKKSCKT